MKIWMDNAVLMRAIISKRIASGCKRFERYAVLKQSTQPSEFMPNKKAKYRSLYRVTFDTFIES